MFTGQLIGYVGADARSNKSGKGFYFPVSSKFKRSWRHRRQDSLDNLLCKL